MRQFCVILKASGVFSWLTPTTEWDGEDMAQTLLYRLFGIGKIPDQIKAEIAQEGSLFQEEGIAGSVTYKNFRRPGRYESWRRQWGTASLAITQTRLIAWFYSRTTIDVPFSDPRFRSLDITLEKPHLLKIAFDASTFHGDWSGQIEYRFRTDQAQVFLDTLKGQSR